MCKVLTDKGSFRQEDIIYKQAFHKVIISNGRGLMLQVMIYQDNCTVQVAYAFSILLVEIGFQLGCDKVGICVNTMYRNVYHKVYSVRKRAEYVIQRHQLQCSLVATPYSRANK